MLRDPVLVGRRVELVFDPFDLTTIAVRLRCVPAGTAIPHRIARHSHLKARPETPPQAPTPTGIDYARLIDIAHQAELAHGVNYAALSSTTPPPPNTTRGGAPDQLPGQLDPLTGSEATPTVDEAGGVGGRQSIRAGTLALSIHRDLR